MQELPFDPADENPPGGTSGVAKTLSADAQTPSPSKKAKGNAVAPMTLEDAFDREVVQDE